MSLVVPGAVCRGASATKPQVGKRVWGSGGGGAAESNGKRPKEDTAEVEASGTSLQLKSMHVERVDSGRPVETFWAMLEDETVDLTLKAVTQMAEVAWELLEQAAVPGEPMAQKAFRCLRELRRGSVQHEEPGCFNTLLRKVKEAYMGNARAHLWQAVRDELGDLGLITFDETEESDVTTEEAGCFWAANASATQPLGDTAEGDDDDAYDDLD